MHFAWPVALLGLLLLPLGALWYLRASRRPPRYAVAYPNVDLLASVVGSSGRWRRRIPLILFALATTLALLGLARPEAKVLVLPYARYQLPANMVRMDAEALRYPDEVPA